MEQRDDQSPPSDPHPHLEALARYLLSTRKSKVNLHGAVCQGKRVRYFRGRRAVNALLDEALKKDFPDLAPRISNRQDAKRELQLLVDRRFLLPVEKQKPKLVYPSTVGDFGEDRFYAWLYEDPDARRWVVVQAVALALGVLALVMFPMWPLELRIAAWYLSVTGLGLFGVLFAILVVRIPFFYISRLVRPPGVWILPNINEDVSVLDSFRPVWDWDQPGKPGKARRRRRGDDHGSGSENAGNDEDADAASGTTTDASTTPSSPAASTSASASSLHAEGGTAGSAGDLRRRAPQGKLRMGAADMRVDSENDGDNEGAENETDADADLSATPQKKAKSH